MYPHHPAEADDGAGSLTVTDGAFGGEDGIDGPEGDMVAICIQIDISLTDKCNREANLGHRRQPPLAFSSSIDQAMGY